MKSLTPLRFRRLRAGKRLTDVAREMGLAIESVRRHELPPSLENRWDGKIPKRLTAKYCELYGCSAADLESFKVARGKVRR